MSIERSPQESPEERYSRLIDQAETEIADTLLRNRTENDAYTAELAAIQLLEKLLFEAEKTYKDVSDVIATGSTEESRQGMLRGVMETIEKQFAEGGYMREVTAKRLAAALPLALEEPRRRM